MSARGKRKAQPGRQEQAVIAPQRDVFNALREIATSREKALTASEVSKAMRAAERYGVSEDLAKDKVMGRLSDLAKAKSDYPVYSFETRGKGQERKHYYVLEGPDKEVHASTGSSLVSEATRLVQEASALRDVLIETSRALDSFIKRLS